MGTNPDQDTIALRARLRLALVHAAVAALALALAGTGLLLGFPDLRADLVGGHALRISTLHRQLGVLLVVVPALLVLAAYVNGRDLEMLVPEASSWPRPRRIPVTVHGRRDLAQHFLSSAVLAATGGDAFSQAIGLFKEIEDARGGSGFSFPDLLADEAGTRFGNMATASAGSAVELQRRAAMADESALVPDPQGLEERMSETEFGQRYGGVGGAGYERELREIARRIDDSPLYR